MLYGYDSLSVLYHTFVFIDYFFAFVLITHKMSQIEVQMEYLYFQHIRGISIKIYYVTNVLSLLFCTFFRNIN